VPRSTERSRELYQRTLNLLIEGGSSPSRGPLNYGEYPLFMQRGSGSRIYDADGNEYIDWMMGFGALPLGHAHPDVANGVAEAATSGAHFATATEIEVEVAELLQRIIPNAERVRFANTGTEAVMAALRLGRGYTRRSKVIKFEGHYHGWYDDLLLTSNPVAADGAHNKGDAIRVVDSLGLNQHALEDTIIVPWNDLAALEHAIAENRGQIAAIITEGIMANMGVIPPAEGYLQGLQELAQQNGIVFILDETVTGFRIAPGGCQEYYKLSPDLVTLGKALGCGLPVAAFVGRAEVMQSLAWGNVLHYGTHNASRIGLHAARASLCKLTENNCAAFTQIWTAGERLKSGLVEIFCKKHIPAIVQGVGPMFQVMFTERSAIRDFREFCKYVDRKAYQRFVLRLFEFGVYTTPAATLHWIVSLAHTEADVDFTLAAAEKALDSLTGAQA
jgi:glutamate-1-semialdehyde 2,1-aminomutase